LELQDLTNRFAYHKPSEAKAETHARVREGCLTLADWLNQVLPESREKSLAVTHLEEVMLWANAALARHDEQGNRLAG